MQQLSSAPQEPNGVFPARLNDRPKLINWLLDIKRSKNASHSDPQNIYREMTSGADPEMKPVGSLHE